MIKKRDLFQKINPYIKAPEAIIVTGMRRTGKTTLLNYFFNKIDSDNKLFIDLENPVNRKYFEVENYEDVRSTFEFLGIDLSKRSYIFLDEIQFVIQLPSIVKYFIDHYKIKFFMTGSASFYLKNLFTESLAGRKYIFELFPLTFQEFLYFKNLNIVIPDNPDDISQAIFNTVSPYYKEYIQYGGFPGVVLKTNIDEKKKALEEIFSSFFKLEVVQLGDYRRNKVIRNLMLLLLSRIGSKVNIYKLSTELGISWPTVNKYISFLEGTYFITLIRPFSRRRDTEIRKMPKVYVCDSGLANQFAIVDEGHLFENSIYQSLRVKGEINYYSRKSGVEIDFILNKEDSYEVKINPTESDVRRLKSLTEEIRLKDFKIISKNYSALENIIYGFMI